jgi:hypothetical protein
VRLLRSHREQAVILRSCRREGLCIVSFKIPRGDSRRGTRDAALVRAHSLRGHHDERRHALHCGSGPVAHDRGICHSAKQRLIRIRREITEQLACAGNLNGTRRGPVVERQYDRPRRCGLDQRVSIEKQRAGPHGFSVKYGRNDESARARSLRRDDTRHRRPVAGERWRHVTFPATGARVRTIDGGAAAAVRVR